MKHIKKILNLKNIFMAHVYAGDPNINFSEKLINALDIGGMDILEIGIPFSDPIADGKVFQQACQRARATRPKDVFTLARRLRKTGFEKPIILTTYYNIIFKMGIKKFINNIVENKIQGIIVPDLPFDESSELQNECRNKRIHYIYLITPVTKNETIKRILEKSSGFIYLVAYTGVTGAKKKMQLGEIVKKIRKLSDIPLFIGFGISKPEQCLEGFDGYIIGSEICRLYQNKKTEKEKILAVSYFARKMKRAICKMN